MLQANPTGAPELEFSDVDRHFGALMMRLARDDDPKIALAASLANQAGPGVTLLVKGSRSARMERVVSALCGTPAGAH